MHSTCAGWRAQLTWGSALLLLAISAASVDLVNNYLYGISIGTGMAAVMVIAAVAVIAVPAAAAIIGKSWHMRGTTAIAVSLTVWAAYHAYSAGQEIIVLASQTRQESYEKAKEKEARAKRVLAQIKETASAKELGKLADKADQVETEAGKRLAGAEAKLSEIDGKLAEVEAEARKSCRKPWLNACKRAQAAQSVAEARKAQAEARKKQAEAYSRQAAAEARLAHVRLSQAEARDKAEADLAKAEAKSEQGGAQKREESQILMWLAIALTQLAALHGGHGVSLIGSGWQARLQRHQQAPQRSPKSRRAAAPAVDVAKTAPVLSSANVVPLNGRKHSVEAWLRAAVKKGGEMKGGEALKAYRRWPEADLAISARELRECLQAIYGSAVEAKTSGYVIHGVQLRSGTEAQAKGVTT